MALALTLLTGTDETAFLYPGSDQLKTAKSASFKLNLGSSYTTGGEALVAATVTAAIEGTCTTILAVMMSGPSADGVIFPAYSPVAGKVLSFTATGTQSSSGDNLSAAAKDVYCTILFV